MTRFIDALTNIFKSNQNHKDEMNPETTPQAQQQVLTSVAEQPAAAQAQPETAATVTAEAHASAIKAKDDEIARLNAEIAALKKAPGAETTHIVDEKPNGGEQPSAEDPASPEAFYNTRQRAQALYDILPR